MRGHAPLYPMKFTPPEIQINDDAPFAEDLFGRESFAHSLSMLIAKAEDNLVIFINAPWGEGKTTFCKMWLASLRSSKRPAIYFDAFAADYLDDPFVSFCGEIVDFLKKNHSDDPELLLSKEKFSDSAISAGTKIIGTLLKVGAGVATAGILNAARLEEIQDAGKEIVEGLAGAGEEFLKAKIEDHEKERESFKEFKERLSAVAKRVKAIEGFPLTIVIDELDRCRPDYAMTVLERIKHLFDVPMSVTVSSGSTALFMRPRRMRKVLG